MNVNNAESSISLIGDRLEDSVVNSGNNVTISTYSGNDTISNSGSRVIINAGAGNDSIKLDSSTNNALILYNKGDGSNVIEGYWATATILIINQSQATTLLLVLATI